MIARIALSGITGLLVYWLLSSSLTSAHAPANQKKQMDCELFIDRLIVGDCVYGPETNNSSLVIVAVFVSWEDLAPGDQILIDFMGQTQTIDPNDISCPDYVQFVVPADGNSYDLTIRTSTGDCMDLVQQVLLPENCDPPVCTSGQSTGGKLYSDFNDNGVQDASEPGIPDVTIRLYGNNQLLDETVTAINGAWSTDSIANATPIRVEYEVPNGLFDGGTGTESQTRVQITEAGNCDLSLGIYATRTVIDENPWIASTCFAKGNNTDPNLPGAQEPTLVLNRYSTTTGGPRLGPNGNYYLANAYETGSIWGLAYHRATRKMFSSAFVKRQAAWGPNGLGAIYHTDLDDFFPDPPSSGNYRYFNRTSLLLNLDDFGIETGDESSIDRNLPDAPTDFAHDTEVFDLVGKWGLGDLDINERGDSLFVVNLYSRTLVIIDIGRPLDLPITTDRVTEIPIPDPGCTTEGDWRPWGLKYYEGHLYVGGVCSAESSQDPDDLWAYIYRWNGRDFEQIIDFNLNYTKGPAEGVYCTNFEPWQSDFYQYREVNNVTCGPSPILSDIEFDSRGNMILGFGDRFGYQAGGWDFGTNPNDQGLYITFTAGDMLKLYNLKGEFLLEKNATSGFYTSPGANNNQGVCGGEFYFQDNFVSHQESILGALASHPSYNTVLTTIMDPSTIWANGWSQMSNADGRKNVSYSIFSGQLGTFGKAAGLGDIELLIGSSSETGENVDIGNYIWIDEDEDGIQDPEEDPVTDLTVVLRDINGTEIGNTTTDNKGRYYFRNLTPETPFFVTLGLNGDYSGNAINIDGQLYVPTINGTRLGFGNRNNDSDAILLDNTAPVSIQNTIGTVYTTGLDNENDFSIDFGLITCTDKGRGQVVFELCENDSVFFQNEWFYEGQNPDSVIISGGARLGCDSVIAVDFITLPRTRGQLDTAICPNGVIQIGTSFFDRDNTRGTVVLEGLNSNGCDSIVEVEVRILAEPRTQIDTSICPGEFLEIEGEIFDAERTEGVIALRGESSRGCDSFVELRLSFLEETMGSLDTSICPGSSFLLGEELFSEGNRFGTITLAGLNQNGCDSIVNVQVNLLEEPYGLLDTFLCPGEELRIDELIFDMNNPLGSLNLSGRGQNGCDSVLEVRVRYFENELSIPPVYQIDYGDSVRLEPRWQAPFNEFLWALDETLSCTDCAYPWASPLVTTRYFISGIDANGCFYETETLVIVNREKGIYIPNVFSPNDDGVNDFFTVYANPFLEIVEELMVFDRWGNKVFQTSDILPNIESLGWDGYYHGEAMNPAVFVYVAHVRWKDGEREMLSGDVTLFR